MRHAELRTRPQITPRPTQATARPTGTSAATNSEVAVGAAHTKAQSQSHTRADGNPNPEPCPQITQIAQMGTKREIQSAQSAKSADNSADGRLGGRPLQAANNSPSEREWVKTRLEAAAKNFPACTTFPVLVRHDLGVLGNLLDARQANWQGRQYGCNWSVTIHDPHEHIQRGWRGAAK
jgi:hypothetical protein